ncbi:Protein phosphatase methylesterase 1 [Allomyces javanicus]|nr:Protein phosphatase methylesterase 1 [Allomyces javanicus]
MALPSTGLPRARAGAAAGAAPVRRSRLANEVTFTSDDSSSSSNDDDRNDEHDHDHDDAADHNVAAPRFAVPHPPTRTNGGVARLPPRRSPLHLHAELDDNGPGADRDADAEDDYDDEDEDEDDDDDDDDYQRPELPLTDSRGEKIDTSTPPLHRTSSLVRGLGSLPSFAEEDEDDVDDDESADTFPTEPPETRIAADPWASYLRTSIRGPEYSPLPWTEMWDGVEDVTIMNPLPLIPPGSAAPEQGEDVPEMDAPTSTFRAYWAVSPALRAAARAQQEQQQGDMDDADSEAGAPPLSLATLPDPETVYVLIHGAGHTGLAWTLCAQTLVREPPVPYAATPSTEPSTAHVLAIAIDLRGHGATHVGNTAAPLTRAQYAGDLVAVLRELFDMERDPHVHAGAAPFVPGDAVTPRFDENRKRPCPRDFVIVGHSLGGAVAAHLATYAPAIGAWPRGGRVLGLAVLDVVEGTALEAMEGGGMQALIMARPNEFVKVADAVRWAVQNHQTSNVQSARLAVQSQLRPRDPDDPNSPLVWIADLAVTEPFWQDWFANLSDTFLHAPCAKILIVAGTDRLDKTLTIAQMQGRFQLHVMGGGVGHCLHEDAPEATARVLTQFTARNARLILPVHKVPPHP